MVYHVYVLVSESGVLYIGVTTFWNVESPNTRVSLRLDSRNATT
jgi:predicted GIY-YIG superfamily endonuclease